MRKFRCPHCKHECKARGTEVAHRCTWNKNRMTAYQEVTDEAEPTRSV
jgi:hypothetical protein